MADPKGRTTDSIMEIPESDKMSLYEKAEEDAFSALFAGLLVGNIFEELEIYPTSGTLKVKFIEGQQLYFNLREKRKETVGLSKINDDLKKKLLRKLAGLDG